MEKIKINEKLYDLIVNGLQLGEQGGKVIFQPGAASFEAVKADIQATKDITVLDDAGEPILTRSDLVYAGRLAEDDNYIIGTEQVEADTRRNRHGNDCRVPGTGPAGAAGSHGGKTGVCSYDGWH